MNNTSFDDLGQHGADWLPFKELQRDRRARLQEVRCEAQNFTRNLDLFERVGVHEGAGIAFAEKKLHVPPFDGQFFQTFPGAGSAPPTARPGYSNYSTQP
jgi:hypothetical protein